jgi:hypothetical protein
MGQRGKKSAASLAVVKQGGITAVVRPEPSDSLTNEQAHEWRSVVNRMPADWFPRETHGMLEAYCRHVVSSRRVADLIESLLTGDLESVDWVGDYDRLLRMQEREGRGMSALATRMRMSQQGQYNHKKKPGSTVKKPWQS